MVANTRDRNIDSSRREDSRVGTVDRCEVIRVHPHVAPLASGDKNFNTVDLQLIDRPYEDDGSLPIIERAEVNTIQHDHGRFQGRPFNYRVGDLVLVYWLSERRGIILGALPTDEQEPVCRSQADNDHQEFVFKLCPWEQPYQDPVTKSFTEFPNPKHPDCHKWWPKTRDSIQIFDCLEGHNTPSCCAQACNSLDDHQSSTCFKNFSDISPTTVDLPRRFKFLHKCGSYWYYDNDGTIELASKLNAALKCHQTFYPSGRILLQNDVTGNFIDIKAADEVEIDAATIRLDGDVEITGSCTHGSCSCDGEFAKLDGVSGGQTLCGGTEVDEELTLCGTTDASKGQVTVNSDLKCNGTMLVQGDDEYNSPGETASLCLGDTNTSLKAVHGFGLKISTYDAVDCVTIEQSTGNMYVLGDVNCASITDHTPGYNGDALAEMKNITNDARGRISHKTLPAFARAKFTDPSTGQETEGRNIGNMVSILTKAVQQLTEKLEAAEKRIAELETNT